MKRRKRGVIRTKKERKQWCRKNMPCLWFAWTPPKFCRCSDASVEKKWSEKSFCNKSTGF